MKKMKNNKKIDYLHNKELWKVGAVIEVNDWDAECLEKDGFELVMDSEILEIKGDKK